MKFIKLYQKVSDLVLFNQFLNDKKLLFDEAENIFRNLQLINLSGLPLFSTKKIAQVNKKYPELS